MSIDPLGLLLLMVWTLLFGGMLRNTLLWRRRTRRGKQRETHPAGERAKHYRALSQKASSSGFASLTARERRLLFDLSKQYSSQTTHTDGDKG